MPGQTVAGAIVTVLKSADGPLSAREIYTQIQSQKLYEFRAKDPFGIVRKQLWSHSSGNNHTCAAQKKLFMRVDKGRFVLVGSRDAAAAD